MSHCRSSTVVSISDTFVSEVVTLSTNSLYCKMGNDMTGINREYLPSVASQGVEWACYRSWHVTKRHALEGIRTKYKYILQWLIVKQFRAHRLVQKFTKLPSRNAAISAIPPLTSCGVCLAAEWQGLVVEYCLPSELCSHWCCRRDCHPHMLPTNNISQDKQALHKLHTLTK